MAINDFDFVLGYNALINLGDQKRGTAILIRDNIQYDNPHFLADGRGISVQIENFKIVNLYAPSGSQRMAQRYKFFNEDNLILLNGSSIYNIILAVDFNCILD